MRHILRGLAAGAAGTTALNMATYLDMAVRARPPSSMPERAVEELAQRSGQEIPGSGTQRDNRVAGLGALAGATTGLGVGVLGMLLTPVSRKLPLPLAAALLGGIAMAGTDAPMAQLGLTDPGSWSAQDWLSDIVPHIAYGLVTAWTLHALERPSRR